MRVGTNDYEPLEKSGWRARHLKTEPPQGLSCFPRARHMLYETYVRRDRMVLDPESLGQFVTLSMIAVALGMDAFSLGLSIGIRGLVFRKIYVISLLIGLF